MSRLESFKSQSKDCKEQNKPRELLAEAIGTMLGTQSNIRISGIIFFGYGTAINFDNNTVAISMLGKGRQTLFIPLRSIFLISDLAISRKHRLFCRFEYRFRLILENSQVLPSL